MKEGDEGACNTYWSINYAPTSDTVVGVCTRVDAVEVSGVASAPEYLRGWGIEMSATGAGVGANDAAAGDAGSDFFFGRRFRGAGSGSSISAPPPRNNSTSDNSSVTSAGSRVAVVAAVVVVEVVGCVSDEDGDGYGTSYDAGSIATPALARTSRR